MRRRYNGNNEFVGTLFADQEPTEKEKVWLKTYEKNLQALAEVSAGKEKEYGLMAKMYCRQLIKDINSEEYANIRPELNQLFEEISARYHLDKNDIKL